MEPVAGAYGAVARNHWKDVATFIEALVHEEPGEQAYTSADRARPEADPDQPRPE